jgi:hypothetical protein
MNAYPTSIREINNLAEPEKLTIYRDLLPEWLFTSYMVDRDTLTVDGKQVVHFRWTPNTRALEIIVKRRTSDADPMLYLNMADTFNNQLLVLLVVIADPSAPRFNIDVDNEGHNTHLGTTSRNRDAEQAAMEAGLAPGQIRRGMRVFKQAVPLFEQFVSKMGHDLFLIEPLAYHNAIVFERYGFNYMHGYKDMQRLHQAFQPDGDLHHRFDDSTPFRQKQAWQTVRGRSWAIHDGILGHPFTGFQMYKRIGIHAEVNSFPDAQW